MAESRVDQGRELWRAVAAFASLQEEQARGFLAGLDRELEPGLEERERLFAVLRQELDRVVPGVTFPPEEEVRLREEIGALLAGEQRLAAAAAQRRAELAGQLGRLRKGRAGLSGYRAGESSAPGARFVSSKG